MSKGFIHQDFLLQNEFARVLYHHYAKELPIIDYHNHLSPRLVSHNHQFQNISEAWLYGDHYKWRAMRTLGIDEEFITGKGSDLEKFQKWAQTVPYTLRNPLYHWTHLELKRYFEIDSLLGPENAIEIYQYTSSLLQQGDYQVQGLLKKMGTELICTTDDPVDSLEYHQEFAKNKEELTMLPAFRPDKAYALEDTQIYLQYLEKLSSASDLEISSFSDLLEALEKRISFFHKMGCRLADHGLESLPFPGDKIIHPENTFKKIKAGNRVTNEAVLSFRFHVLMHLCKVYHKKGWVQQFHLGALRNTNERRVTEYGADTGYDSIGDFQQATSLSLFLSELEKTNQLAKTILYNLNPADNELMATMAGNFSASGIRGKVQYGSAWWFLDQQDGIEKQLNSLSNMSLLSCFIGMLTDSRSFLSFPRHEYFRRVLCNLLGNDVQKGLLPKDEKWLGKIVRDICYYNAKEYFPF